MMLSSLLLILTIPDISLHAVSNTAECEALMAKGWGNRAVGATKMNADSSRSHSIFTINIEMLDTGATGNEHIRKVNMYTDGHTCLRRAQRVKMNLCLSLKISPLQLQLNGQWAASIDYY